MGIGVEAQALLKDVIAKLPPKFSVCELGDQLYHAFKNGPFVRNTRKNRRPAREWYEAQGCGHYVSMDANGRADVLVDLNEIPSRDAFEQITAPFDLVTNFGTTEHVFDLAQCWETIHYLTKPGGWIVGELPHDGHPDHGFVNYQPTFFRDLAAANGYSEPELHVATVRRGKVIRFAMHKGRDTSFVKPTQGKYLEDLRKTGVA